DDKRLRRGPARSSWVASWVVVLPGAISTKVSLWGPAGRKTNQAAAAAEASSAANKNANTPKAALDFLRLRELRRRTIHSRSQLKDWMLVPERRFQSFDCNLSSPGMEPAGLKLETGPEFGYRR